MKMRFLMVFALLFATVVLANQNQELKGEVRDVGLNIGNKAPEIVEKAIDGSDVKLSSLRGKVVLIDFWASWCGPCRRENPNIVAAYEKFKTKEFKDGNGFTVFSVSLDNNKDAWVKAIQDDNLSWEVHVSDLKGWYSKYAAIYGVRGIPSNYLINGDGIIVGRNLRGPTLDQALTKLLK